MKYAVYAQYGYATVERGEIISTHKTRILAERAAVDSTGHMAIREVPDQARKGGSVYQYD